MMEGNLDLLHAQAEHLEFLTLTDTAAGLDWYARHLPWKRRSQMDYQAASALLFSRLEGETVTPALSPEAEGWRQSGEYSVSERLS